MRSTNFIKTSPTSHKTVLTYLNNSTKFQLFYFMHKAIDSFSNTYEGRTLLYFCCQTIHFIANYLLKNNKQLHKNLPNFPQNFLEKIFQQFKYTILRFEFFQHAPYFFLLFCCQTIHLITNYQLRNNKTTPTSHKMFLKKHPNNSVKFQKKGYFKR